MLHLITKLHVDFENSLKMLVPLFPFLPSWVSIITAYSPHSATLPPESPCSSVFYISSRFFALILCLHKLISFLEVFSGSLRPLERVVCKFNIPGLPQASFNLSHYWLTNFAKLVSLSYTLALLALYSKLSWNAFLLPLQLYIYRFCFFLDSHWNPSSSCIRPSGHSGNSFLWISNHVHFSVAMYREILKEHISFSWIFKHVWHSNTWKKS